MHEILLAILLHGLPPIFRQVGIELTCYYRRHQRERAPFGKGADDAFQFGQAVHTAVQVSDLPGILEVRISNRPNCSVLRASPDFDLSLEKGVHGEGPEIFSHVTTIHAYEKRISKLERLIGHREVEMALLTNLFSGISPERKKCSRLTSTGKDSCSMRS